MFKTNSLMAAGALALGAALQATPAQAQTFDRAIGVGSFGQSPPYAYALINNVKHRVPTGGYQTYAFQAAANKGRYYKGQITLAYDPSKPVPTSYCLFNVVLFNGPNGPVDSVNVASGTKDVTCSVTAIPKTGANAMGIGLGIARK